MKLINKCIFASLFLILSIPSTCWSFQLSDLYTMSDNDRVWYLGGVYDSNLSSWNDKGVTSDCLEKMKFQGFVLKVSEFVTSLPEDPNSKERKVYDNMNAAAVSWLVIQKACKLEKT